MTLQSNVLCISESLEGQLLQRFEMHILGLMTNPHNKELIKSCRVGYDLLFVTSFVSLSHSLTLPLFLSSSFPLYRLTHRHAYSISHTYSSTLPYLFIKLRILSLLALFFSMMSLNATL